MRLRQIIGLAVLLVLSVLTVGASCAETDLAAIVSRLIAQLDDEDFQKREAASRAIAELPVEAYALVQAALKGTKLSAEVRKRLEAALEALHFKAQRAQADARKAARMEYNTRILLDAYNNIGRHDPKWDELAHAALTQIVNWIAKDPRYLFNEELALDLFDKCVVAGCNDPLILYQRQNMRYIFELETRGESAHTDIVESFADSGYAESVRLFALIHGTKWMLATKDADAKTKAEVLLRRALKLFPPVVKDVNVSPSEIVKRCTEWISYASSLGKDRSEVCTEINALLENECPRKNIPYLVKAQIAENDAYKTAAQVEKTKRLAEAEEALNEAWKIDPIDGAAATAMVSVCVGGHQPREKMELWFKRATEADAEGLRPYLLKAKYLDPKWYGSKEELLAFGRECGKSTNWIGGVPYVLVNIHQDMAEAAPDEAAYYRNPDVWKDIEEIHEGWLKRFPDAVYEHLRYARIASLTEHWEIAVREFKLVGDHPTLRHIFKDRATYDKMRKEAAEHAGK